MAHRIRVSDLYRASGPELDAAVHALRGGARKSYSWDIVAARDLMIEMEGRCAGFAVISTKYDDGVRWEANMRFDLMKQTYETSAIGYSDTFEGAICACYVSWHEGKHELHEAKRAKRIEQPENTPIPIEGMAHAFVPSVTAPAVMDGEYETAERA